MGTRIPQRTLRSLLDTATAELGHTFGETSFTYGWCDTLAITAISDCHLFPEEKTSYDYDEQLLDEAGG